MSFDQITFQPAQLHPAAAEAIDKDATALVAAVEVGTMEQQESSSFKSRRIPKHTITDEDLIGEPLMTWSDLSGRTAGRYFVRDGQLVALREQGYRQLRRLVEKVLRAKPFSAGFSETFLEVEIFKWWRATLRGETSAPLSTQLLNVAGDAFALHRIMVPLAHLEIERPFKLGHVLVTPFDAQLFDTFESEAVVKFPEHADVMRQEAQKMRDEFGHLTAIQVDIAGEVEFAQERARVLAFDMADIVRFMSPPAVSWNITYACFPTGYEHEPSSTVIQLRDDKLALISSGLLGAPSFRWKLSFAELDKLMTKLQFRNCAVFFEKRSLTGYEKRVKTAISAYAQAVAAIDLRNRLIYAMSAAEHLLLRDENEPIQASVGERMAFLIAKEPDTRRAVVANFKKAYGLRSRHVHHLANIDDEDVLTVFFANMWTMLLTAMQNLPRFQEQAQFLDAIDRIKFA